MVMVRQTQQPKHKTPADGQSEEEYTSGISNNNINKRFGANNDHHDHHYRQIDQPFNHIRLLLIFYLNIITLNI